MRTLGHIPHERLKITLMQQGRFLLKLEDQDVEVVYRFREDEGVHDLRSAAQVLRGGLLTAAESALRDLAAARLRHIRMAPPPTDDFPSIV